MNYVEDGYWEIGYANGDITINSTTRIVFDVKKTSTKTKEEVIAHVKTIVEARQESVGITSAVYADIYDVRDKSITRVFSTVSDAVGIGSNHVAFGGDIEQITNITSFIDQKVTQVEATIESIQNVSTTFINNTNTMIDQANAALEQSNQNNALLSSALVPRLKVVNPFEALIIDTEMTAADGSYMFEFDTAQIGNGNYHIAIEFVEPTVGV